MIGEPLHIYVKSLNGIWKFNLARHPDERPKKFYCLNYDVSQWSNIKEPANWELEGFDTPIYVNTKYPFRKNPSYIQKHYNPVGCRLASPSRGRP